MAKKSGKKKSSKKKSSKKHSGKHESYGEEYAALFDLVYGTSADEREIETLAELANGGSVLELGIGTGRTALPLAARGLDVHGVDKSEKMLAQLAKKPGGRTVRKKVTVSTLPEVKAKGKFSLVTLLDNALLLLTTQDEQAACIKNAVKHLATNGLLVVETFAAPSAPSNSGVLLAHLGEDATSLWAYEADTLTQKFHVREIVIGSDAKLLGVVPFDGRGVTPAELDLMARLAGLRLRERWSDWGRTPAQAGCQMAISIYEQES